MGGEKLDPLTVIFFAPGSPPHGRGKVFFFTHINVCKGITPAWAGKSKEPLKICEKQEDHPRMGGEKLVKHCHGTQ